MTKDRIRFVKNICWFLFLAICVFHFWLDGRNGTMTMELKRQGQSLASAGGQIYSLCGQLNTATLIVLILIVVLSFKSK